jgi:nicotinamidase-related amidase
MTRPIDPKRTALFLLDFQNMIVGRLPNPEPVTTATVSAVASARKRGITVAHCRVAFDQSDIDSIPDTNFSFGAMKENPQMLSAIEESAPTSQIIKELTPEPGELVLRKTRYGPFMCGPSARFPKAFKEKGIDTLVFAGVVTSGAVLSAVRQAADLDFMIYVLEDCCADQDDEVHKILMEKVFPRQGYVIKSTELETL